MTLSRTIVIISIQCWLGIGFVLSCVASFTLLGHEPAPIIVKGLAQVIQTRELQYGPLTVSLLNNGESGLALLVVRTFAVTEDYSSIYSKSYCASNRRSR